jgi:AcrR family transcriptional regulator
MATRPRDRKAQIARASAEAFSLLGYHRVTMEDIAARVGVSATALYRHYSGKYELFRGAVLSLGQQLVDATESVGDPHADPVSDLRRLVTALIDTSLANRESGGLYRWEGRFLSDDDQHALNRQLDAVHRRLQQPIVALHPAYTARQRWTASTAVLSVIGSIVDHRARLPAKRIRALLTELAVTMATADVMAASSDDRRRQVRVTRAPRSRYEALLDESMRLFNERGYHDTSVEQIAAAVGLPASGVYRYFPSKSDLLAASFRRAADSLSVELTAVAADATDPEDVLTAMTDAYVGRSFERPDLAYVYYTERLNLSEADQKALRSMQRSTVETWVTQVVAVRPELTDAEARFVVHAATALVIDIGRLNDDRDTVGLRALVSSLLDLALLGRYRLRMALPAR